MVSLCTLTRTAAFAALGALALTNCSGGIGGGAVPRTLDAQARAAAPNPDVAGKALYVSDSYGKSVFRFALASDGTLVAPAGSSLVLAYNPGAIAVGPGGLLYVCDQGNESIEVYKPRASGSAKPLRSLMLPFAPSSVGVDANGYLFVGGFSNGFVAVYAPKAHGMAPSIQQIALPDHHLSVNGVALDSQGDLYMSDTNEISEFTTPTTNPTLFRAIIGAGEQNVPSGMALARNGELYAANTGSSNILAYSPTANGKDGPDRTIVSTNPPLVGPIGVAIRGTTLYSTSGTTFFGPPSVFVLNALQGTQTPKQVVTGPYLASPIGAALGP